LIIKTRIFSLSLVIFLSSVLLIGIIISSSSHVYAQQSSQRSNQKFPSSITAASSTDTTPHVLKLKATQQGEDGQPKKVSGFKIGLKNVVTAQINSQVLVFITDNSVKVIGAKVRTASDQLIDLIPSTGQTNVFSLRGLPLGVYTLDIITQKGNTKAAYEGILVISQQSTTVINENTKNVINQEINQKTKIDTDTHVKVIFKEKDDDKNKNKDKDGNDPCNYYGLNVCNDKGECDDDRFDCYSDDCVDGKPGTTGQCDGDDDKDCWDNGEWNGKCDDGKDDNNKGEKLPLCDGSYQDCVTDDGHICEAGSTDDECELNGYYCIEGEGEGCGNYVHGICETCTDEVDNQADPCSKNPRSAECQPEDPCIENPDAEGCQPEDPCIENPDAEGCQEPLPPTDSCEENSSLPECQQGDTGAALAGEEPIDEGDDGEKGAALAGEEPIDEGDDVDEGNEGNGASGDEVVDESDEEGGDEEE
jgi:hypothetical protein